jgi:hypothetical protein
MGDCGGSGDAPNTSTTNVVAQPARAVGRPTVTGVTDACIGNVGAPGDVDDWYSFTANTGQQLRIVLASDGAVDPNLYVYDPGGQERYSMVGASPVIPEFHTGDPITAQGTWKIRVRPGSGAGNYLMLFDVRDQPNTVPTVPSVGGVPQLGNDCNTGKADAPNTNAGLTTIPSNTACAGQLGIPSSDTADWYAFNAVAEQDVVAIVVAENTLDPNLDLYTPAGVRVFPPNHFDAPIPEYFRYTIPKNQGGLWRIAVSKRAGAGKYALFLSNPSQLSPGGVNPTVPPASVPATPVPSVSPPAVGSPDCDLGRDASNSRTTADSISPPKGCTAHMPATDNDDWYRFNASSGQRITVNVGGEASLDPDVVVYAPNGDTFRSANAGPRAESVDTYAADNGVYYVQVHRRAGSGDYGMTVTVA